MSSFPASLSSPNSVALSGNGTNLLIRVTTTDFVNQSFAMMGDSLRLTVGLLQPHFFLHPFSVLTFCRLDRHFAPYSGLRAAGSAFSR